MKSRFFLSLIFLAVLFISCESGSDDFTIIDIQSEHDQYAIEVYNDLIYLAGGEAWKECDLSISSDGKIWSTEYFTNRALFDLHATDDQLLAVGTSGYLFSGEEVMKKQEIESNNLLKAITGIEDGYIAIAGKDFNKGWINPIDNEYNILEEHFFDHELTDIKCDSDGNCIVVGYGIILSSLDGGLTWLRSEQTGDFYNSVGYNSEDIPYAVGYNGSILFSMDNGLSWETIKSGHSPLHDNKPFRKIKFYNNVGYIVGDNGTIWKSEDNGKSWDDISINTDIDLLDFVLFGDELIIASEAGKVIIVKR